MQAVDEGLVIVHRQRIEQCRRRRQSSREVGAKREGFRRRPESTDAASEEVPAACVGGSRTDLRLQLIQALALISRYEPRHIEKRTKRQRIDVKARRSGRHREYLREPLLVVRRVTGERERRRRFEVAHAKDRDLEIRVGTHGLQRAARVERGSERSARIHLLFAVVRASLDAETQREWRDPSLAQLAVRFQPDFRVVGRACASAHSRERGIQRGVCGSRPLIRKWIEALRRIGCRQRSGEFHRVEVGGLAVRQPMVELETRVPVPGFAEVALRGEKSRLPFRGAVSLYRTKA